MKNISISLPPEILEIIDRERAPRHCSRSQFIRDALAIRKEREEKEVRL